MGVGVRRIVVCDLRHMETDIGGHAPGEQFRPDELHDHGVLLIPLHPIGQGQFKLAVELRVNALLGGLHMLPEALLVFSPGGNRAGVDDLLVNHVGGARGVVVGHARLALEA
jgi:hypothetical protein